MTEYGTRSFGEELQLEPIGHFISAKDRVHAEFPLGVNADTYTEFFLNKATDQWPSTIEFFNNKDTERRHFVVSDSYDTRILYGVSSQVFAIRARKVAENKYEQAYVRVFLLEELEDPNIEWEEEVGQVSAVMALFEGELRYYKLKDPILGLKLAGNINPDGGVIFEDSNGERYIRHFYRDKGILNG